MKILIVSNEYTTPKRLGNPIIERIIEATRNDERVESVNFCPFKNTFGSFPKIRKDAKLNDIVHIHFGGIYALLVWIYLIGLRTPKLITFHGTDLHAGELATTKPLLSRIKIRLNRVASIISVMLFSSVGLVSDSLIDYIPKLVLNRCKTKIFIQSLGVDFSLFKEKSTIEAQKELGLECGKYILFSDKSNTPIKRKDLAEEIVSHLNGYKLLIMCGVSPVTVPLYLNSSDAVLITSDMEGSPNIVREALALNKRVFSVDVGDVRKQIEGLKDSSIISRTAKEAANLIGELLNRDYSDNTRTKLKNNLDINRLTSKVVDIYDLLISKRS